MIISLVMPDAPLRARRTAAAPLVTDAAGTPARTGARSEQAGQDDDEQQQQKAHTCRGGASAPPDRQFVKRRIRTLRIRPNPAKVAIMEEPP